MELDRVNIEKGPAVLDRARSMGGVSPLDAPPAYFSDVLTVASQSSFNVTVEHRQVFPIARIIRFVCDEFQVSQIDLLSNRRDRDLARARQAGYWLCRKFTLASYPQIGRMFGGRDHTTVMYGHELVGRHVSRRTDFGVRVLALLAKIDGRTQ